MIDKDTMLFALLGRPVEHSLSPLIQNYFMRIEEVPAEYMAFEIKEGNLGEALKRLHVLECPGANITIPFKEEVIPLLEEISERARLCGAVNTLIKTEKGYRGDNTDGTGLLASLKKEENWEPKDKKIIVLGAGGAARAVAVNFALEGAEKIVLVNRSLERAEKIAKLVRENSSAKCIVLDWTSEHLFEEVAEAEAVFNTTPLGMYPKTEELPPLPYSALRKGQLVVDLIYNPLQTMFLQEAAAKGCRTVNGLGMLIHQAALSFELWTKIPPEIEGLTQRVTEQLTARRGE